MGAFRKLYALQPDIERCERLRSGSPIYADPLKKPPDEITPKAILEMIQ